MELDMQKKLLRFLQTGTFTPLGGSRELKVDVRIICATNRDPLLEVEEGRFREDLYYRVHVVPIEMPPLKERGNDITTLATHFLRVFAKEDGKKFNGINRDAESLLKRYAWPGNVRQLQNVIRNIVVLNNDTKLAIEHLPEQMTSGPKAPKPKSPQPTLSQPVPPVTQDVSTSSQLSESTVYSGNEHTTEPPKGITIRPMWMVEREAIQQAIDYCDGNVLNAAVLLELSPSTVYRKKQAWETEEDEQQYAE
ncbi:hypothetical protein GCM10007938_27040 [Vibrio zhanjiangensis]|uniref:Sigma-54 factor interaction domain-containing protein n=1 Tax=Vibrio zhanjiangensis TaxID=1046128 RepID=A0ABQ6F0A6_9VIBR|nr:hypothetical protein GCM10007938_27040 [Vibrio zhanjiangensis]